MAEIPDVLVGAPDAYRLLLENDRVRVMEIRLGPGEVAPMHSHPSDHVVYVLSPAQIQLRSAEASEATFALDAGQTLWLEAGPHETTNVGATDVHNLVIEIKS